VLAMNSKLVVLNVLMPPCCQIFQYSMRLQMLPFQTILEFCELHSLSSITTSPQVRGILPEFSKNDLLIPLKSLT
jgi:hypothetical protein